MEYRVEERDLFSVNNNNSAPYVLGHCISSDFGMGKGIVVMFNKLYDMKTVLVSKYRNQTSIWHNNGYVLRERVIGENGDCTQTVYNLITKQHVDEKPTYKTLEDSLFELKAHMKQHGETKLAIPLIGCGLDELKWSRVESLIKTMFEHTNIEVLVCYLERDKNILTM